MSHAQEAWWFLQQFDPDGGICNRPAAWQVRGAVNPELLRKALNAIVERHEVLRTVFPSVEGRPVVRLLSQRGIELPIEEVAGASPDAELRRRLATNMPASMGVGLA